MLDGLSGVPTGGFSAVIPLRCGLFDCVRLPGDLMVGVRLLTFLGLGVDGILSFGMMRAGVSIYPRAFTKTDTRAQFSALQPVVGGDEQPVRIARNIVDAM